MTNLFLMFQQRILKFILLLLLLVAKTKAQCSTTNRTTYLRSNALELETSTDFISIDQSLASCQLLCTNSQDISCNSFQYDVATGRCMISDAGAQPFGPASVIPSHSSVSFYQKICIPSSTKCDAPFSFERIPQRVLVGFSHEVIPASSVSDCLRLCLEANQLYGFYCKSVMYFYETAECIMNPENRHARPDLFSSDTQGFIVDYFENFCDGVTCFDGSVPHYIRSENMELNVIKDKRIENVKLDECQQFCDDNIANGEPVACKSFLFDALRYTCFLFNARPKPRGNAQFIQKLGAHHYEKICLRTETVCNSEFAFDRASGHVLVGHSEFVMPTADLADCLSLCLLSNCRSAMYFYEQNECILNGEDQFSQSRLFSNDGRALEVDYFDNRCIGKSNNRAPTRPIVPVNAGPTTNRGTGIRTHTSTSLPRTHPITVQPTFPQPRPFPVDSNLDTSPHVNGRLETECRYDGIYVKVHFSRATTGSLFVKNHYDTCRSDFFNSTDARVKLTFPDSEQIPECGGSEISPGMFAYTVIVQKNGFGIPGLVTNTDRLFNITCDYSEDNNRRVVTAHGGATVTGFPPTINVFGAGFSDIAPTIRMMILRDNKPVKKVLLGEELDLKWEIEEHVDADVGYLIRECVAERLGGNPPQPAPVKLISDGCPDPNINHRLITAPILPAPNGFQTKMTMFRFDGSRSVKMRCTVDVCHKQCTPRSCPFDFKNENSVKRTKRQHNFEANWSIEDKIDDVDEGSIIEKETISGVFFIVDRLEPQDQAAWNFDNNRNQDPMGAEKQSSKTFLMENGKLCFVRPLFICLATFLVLLTLMQVSVIFIYFWNKYNKRSEPTSKFQTLTTNGSTSGSEWYHSWHKLLDNKLRKMRNKNKVKDDISDPPSSSDYATTSNERVVRKEVIPKSKSRPYERPNVDSNVTTETSDAYHSYSVVKEKKGNGRNRSRKRQKVESTETETSDDADTVMRTNHMLVRVETHKQRKLAPPLPPKRRDSLPSPLSPPSSRASGTSSDIDRNWINRLPPPPAMELTDSDVNEKKRKKVHFVSEESLGICGYNSREYRNTHKLQFIAKEVQDRANLC